MRHQVSFAVAEIARFKGQLLQWSSRFEEIAWLDSNAHADRYSAFDALLAVDAQTLMSADASDAFKDLSDYRAIVNDWIFGYLSYDLKNDVERLTSKNTDRLHFPDIYFFQPKKIIRIRGDIIDFIYLVGVADEIEMDFKAISEMEIPGLNDIAPTTNVRIKLAIFKDEYYRRVGKMLDHIHRGDLYEANFCQEFYAENTHINALMTYRKLNAISKAPFASFLRMDDKYLLSASPERYLRKKSNMVVSQPIKGTARRSGDPQTDLLLKTALEQDGKERAENIMIVDLVRNDLSKSARKGSVSVVELCEVRSYEQVHQMMSTVTAIVAPDKIPEELLKETFPMGSMTGAPKVSAMKIIEALESFRRGLYSGAVGYLTPEGDFDFNVVIRSILYNDTEKYVSFSVGSAITAKASPEAEYQECLLKAKAMREVLEGYV